MAASDACSIQTHGQVNADGATYRLGPPMRLICRG